MRIGKAKPKYSEKTRSSDTLCTINPTWPDLKLNSDHRSGKPPTSLQTYDAAEIIIIIIIIV
jgi:hypothetical protein